MSRSTVHEDASEFARIALEKMSAVLGAGRARSLLAEICERHRIAMRTADDLFRFGTELSKMGGFEAAVGALLTVRAVMRGATPP